MTADFSITTPLGEVVAEVEEITPNDEDKQLLAAFESGNLKSYGTIIGKRSRSKIRHAAKQLKPYRDKAVPLVIALFDNVQMNGRRYAPQMLYTSGMEIDAALFGDRSVGFDTNSGQFSDVDFSGGNRTFTATEKTYISAVAVISDSNGQELFIYHNPFSSVPLPLSIWNDLRCHHYTKPKEIYGSPWNWNLHPKD